MAFAPCATAALAHCRRRTEISPRRADRRDQLRSEQKEGRCRTGLLVFAVGLGAGHRQRGHAMVDDAFRRQAHARLVPSHNDNAASARVLGKLGFEVGWSLQQLFESTGQRGARDKPQPFTGPLAGRLSENLGDVGGHELLCGQGRRCASRPPASGRRWTCGWQGQGASGRTGY